MKKRIIEINEEKCVGCGACANACAQGAIQMVNGKAKVVREDYCDGLGNCLPACPVGAINFSDKEVMKKEKNKEEIEVKKTEKEKEVLPCGCPGMNVKKLEPKSEPEVAPSNAVLNSELSQWPVQLKLVPANAPYFDDAHLLIAADCAAYAYANFHKDFIKGKVTIIGCPKLDNEDYSEKLARIIQNNYIKSITLVKMEVPCCGGLEMMLKEALKKSGAIIPWSVKTITLDGNIQGI
ncbi:4Fe-4S ferredoxin iron-sulfur binding domain protein [Elusimicrobium minutum Pei191]|uniref:4Fe-4S ferredoxin iron-sulfur binding domain protein n=1 Tax=Elusimicrobium minutum (strain Pei191) TaxID=445932 RepID=B2KD71_ELUMP|nr:4Fe-4S binding protein [Elusimicrobium minutum]ACC98467.1 4Fe-4S ferredoxin iron-sulfur binding domain protein [Elusimicrobium minutum Pei191]